MSSNRHTTLDSSIAAAIRRAQQLSLDSGAVIDNRVHSPLLTAHVAPVPMRGADEAVNTYTLDQLLPPQSGHSRMVTIDQDVSIVTGRGSIGRWGGTVSDSRDGAGPGGEVQLMETAPGMWDTGFDQTAENDKGADGAGGGGGSITSDADPSGVVGAIVESEKPTAPCPEDHHWAEEPIKNKYGMIVGYRWVCKPGKDPSASVNPGQQPINRSGTRPPENPPVVAVPACNCELSVEPRILAVDITALSSFTGTGVIGLKGLSLSSVFKVTASLTGSLSNLSTLWLRVEGAPQGMLIMTSLNPRIASCPSTQTWELQISEEWIREQHEYLRNGMGSGVWTLKFIVSGLDESCSSESTALVATCSLEHLLADAGRAQTNEVVPERMPDVVKRSGDIGTSGWDDAVVAAARAAGPGEKVAVAWGRYSATLSIQIESLQSSPDCCCSYISKALFRYQLELYASSFATGQIEGSALSELEAIALANLHSATLVLENSKAEYPKCNDSGIIGEHCYPLTLVTDYSSKNAYKKDIPADWIKGNYTTELLAVAQVGTGRLNAPLGSRSLRGPCGNLTIQVTTFRPESGFPVERVHIRFQPIARVPCLCDSIRFIQVFRVVDKFGLHYAPDDPAFRDPVTGLIWGKPKDVMLRVKELTTPDGWRVDVWPTSRNDTPAPFYSWREAEGYTVRGYCRRNGETKSALMTDQPNMTNSTKTPDFTMEFISCAICDVPNEPYLDFRVFAWIRWRLRHTAKPVGEADHNGVIEIVEQGIDSPPLSYYSALKLYSK